MSGIEHASNQSIKPFKSSEEYLYAMKEDLAEWLGELYNTDIRVNNILGVLETGALLCAHANNVTRVADEFQKTVGATEMQLPVSGVTFVSSAHPTTFLARDNVSNFINWCRKEMGIPDVLMFETDDLVLRKNEKNFVLCLLEVARRASRFGMASPVLIQLEQEIEEEIREEMEETIQPKPQRRLINSQNLDEMVHFLVSRCTCPSQFPMMKVSEGKYRVGDSNTLIFVRILRNHVMVRVGGGWDTLEHYLDKHDPCRCNSLIHKFTQRPVTPVHEIKERLTVPQPDAQCGSQTLLLSRSQSPHQPVVWSPSSPYRSQRAGSRSSYSPDPEHQTTHRRNSPSPNKLRERPSTPSNLHTGTDSKDIWITNSSSRKGRAPTRSSPTPRLTSSLPCASYCPATPQPDIQRPQTPLVLQIQQQQSPEKNLGQTWTKSHFVSKLRQNSTAGVKGRDSHDRTNGKEYASPGRILQSPTSDTKSSSKPPNITIQEPEDGGGLDRSAGFIRTFSPSKMVIGVISEAQRTRSRTPTRKTPDGNEKTQPENRGNRAVNDKVQSLTLPLPNMVPSPHISSNSLKSKTDSGGEEVGKDIGCLYTPSPLSPAQEAILYKSLEEEILSNLQQLSIDSNSSSDENLGEIPQKSGEVSSDYCEVTSLLKSKSHAQIDSFRTLNNGHGVGFDAVIAELSITQRKMEKMSIEKWVNTLPRGLTSSSLLKVSKPPTSSSRSSLGSSMDSKETEDLVDRQNLERRMTCGKVSGVGTEHPKKQRSSSLKRRRSLKKPERVPSIYKLKLRPCVQPRRDHRSDRKPSKIPKPVFYKKISHKDGNSHSQRENDFSRGTLSSRNSHGNTKPKCNVTVQSAKKCQRTNQEARADQDLESWV